MSGVDPPLERGVVRPHSSHSATALRRNQLNDECKAAESAMRDVANKVPGAEVAFAAALQTPGGRKAFPALAKPYEEKSTAQAVVTAVAGALGELSQSRVRNPRTVATSAAVGAIPVSHGRRVPSAIQTACHPERLLLRKA